MTAHQYRAALDRLGLTTQAEAAQFLGVSLRTAHGWANGTPIPEIYARVIRLTLEQREQRNDQKADSR